jgi:long-subunit acyl-CoA synthetase (AMP-forming)
MHACARVYGVHVYDCGSNLSADAVALDHNAVTSTPITSNGQVASVGAYLASKWPKQTPVGIFSINREEWVVSQWALWRQALICVPLYDTLGATAISFIVNHTELALVFASGQGVDKLLKVRAFVYVCLMHAQPSTTPSALTSHGQEAASLRTLKEIVSFDPLTPEQVEAAKATNVKLTEYSGLTVGTK